MIGFGTVVNTAAVILGGFTGMAIKGGLKKNVQDILMQACGISTMVIGISGTLSGMFSVSEGKIQTSGTLLLIASLVIGGLVGELLKLEDRMDALGEKMKKLAKRENDTSFVDGFVTSSLVICVGAMAVVGSIRDGLSGDAAMLYSKAVLDFVVVAVFASAFGLGAVFSAVPLAVYQGLITLLAVFIAELMTERMISELSYVGSAMIIAVGINIVFGKKVKVGNMLPGLFVPIIYECISALF